MKKLIFVFSFFIGAIYTTHSQILISMIFGDKLNSDKLAFGLTVGASSSTITNLENAKYANHFSFGLYFNIKLAEKNWFLHTGAIPKSTYGAKNLTLYELGDPSLDSTLQTANLEKKFGIINVPILISYQTNNFWGFELGPMISLRTKVKDIFTVKYDDSKNTLVYTNLVSDSYKRISFEGAAGIYKILRKGKGVTLNLRYIYGLHDILKNNPGASQHHSVFTFLVGIPVGANKEPKEPEVKD